MRYQLDARPGKVLKRILVVTSAVLVVAALGILFILSRHGFNPAAFLAQLNQPECDGGPYFAAAPVDLENIGSIIPLGNLSPSAHTFPTDHVYFNFPLGVQDIPVYAPGDVTITGVRSTLHAYADPPFTDYAIDMNVCKDLNAYYIHVHELSASLQQAFERHKGSVCERYETGGQTYENCTAHFNLAIAAGERIATTARVGQNNFDLGIYDETKDPWTFANPDRFSRGNRYRYTQCPFDYYEPEMQAMLTALLGDGQMPRTIQPVCGTVGQDVPGTAQGLWFVSETIDQRFSEDQHMALVHDNFDPTIGVFSVGTALAGVGIPTNRYIFDPADSGLVNRDFDQVKPDEQVYCYEATSGFAPEFTQHTILLSLVDADTLRISLNSDSSCGTGPWSLTNPVTFHR